MANYYGIKILRILVSNIIKFYAVVQRHFALFSLDSYARATDLSSSTEYPNFQIFTPSANSNVNSLENWMKPSNFEMATPRNLKPTHLVAMLKQQMKY
jgi:hypothetical protein